jgi:hypothetical protein
MASKKSLNNEEFSLSLKNVKKLINTQTDLGKDSSDRFNEYSDEEITRNNNKEVFGDYITLT